MAHRDSHPASFGADLMRARETKTGADVRVDEYLARVPEPARSRLTQMRSAIRSAVPREATEIMSYRMPAFRHDVVLVWYGAFANHVSLFPGGSVLERFNDELTGFRTSKGTIQFPLTKPLPIALIKKIVKARVAEVAARKPR
jgi:uncharacterized protein YdhG (YjbR/CyaY superfamily)